MPRYTVAPRAPRRRFELCLRAVLNMCCCVVLVCAVILVVLNIARIFASELDLQRVPRVTETPRPPNYYEQIGVSPLISQEDLRVKWKKYGLEHHPDKKTATALTLEQVEDYLQKQRIFETLLDGVLRCEYDKDHRIKGRWQATTCRQAFPEAYRARMYKELEEVREKQEAAAAAKSGGRKVKVKVEVEQQQPLKVEAEKQQPLITESGRTAHPQARPAVPVVTVELSPEPENRIFSVDSIPGFKALKSGGIEVWNNGIMYSWIQLKVLVADCQETTVSVFRALVNGRHGRDLVS